MSVLSKEPDALKPLISIDRAEAERQYAAADKLLIIGCVLIGTYVLGPIGLVLVIVALLRFGKLSAAGHDFRSWAVTIIGAFCLVDAGCNMLGWGLDLFAHDTFIGASFITDWGKAFDAAYVYGYNTTPLGGLTLVSEKALQVVAIGLLFPMRIAAAYAFLKMKRWGYQYMIVTSWMYVFFWIFYVVAFDLTFQERTANATFGVLGWWFINGPFITPFVMLAWLYTVNRDSWNK